MARSRVTRARHAPSELPRLVDKFRAWRHLRGAPASTAAAAAAPASAGLAAPGGRRACRCARVFVAAGLRGFGAAGDWTSAGPHRFTGASCNVTNAANAPSSVQYLGVYAEREGTAVASVGERAARSQTATARPQRSCRRRGRRGRRPGERRRTERERDARRRAVADDALVACSCMRG